MKQLALLILALLCVAACDPTPAPTATPDAATVTASATRTPKPTETKPAPSATSTAIHPMFTVASETAAYWETQGTRVFPTSSIYGDATRYAQTATERARWTPPTPTQEVWTPEVFETWRVVVNTLNIRPQTTTSIARIGSAENGDLLQTTGAAIVPAQGEPGHGFVWYKLHERDGYIAVQTASGSSVYAERD